VAASVNRADARITCTPRPSKRAWESCGAMLAITSWTWSCTAAKSTFGAAAAMPKASPDAAQWACLAAAIMALDGTQPKFRQSPPIAAFSISTTRWPNWAATAATESPAEPAPITHRSHVMAMA
jgi:hypothetical protein